MSKSGVAGSYGGSGFSFLRKLHAIHHSGHTNLHSTNSARGSLFSIPFLAFIVCRFFDENSGHSGLVTSKDLRVAVIVWLLSHVELFATLWTVAHQAPLSTGFPRQEYRSGLPFPSPKDLHNPGIEPGPAALQADSLPSEPLGSPI